MPPFPGTGPYFQELCDMVYFKKIAPKCKFVDVDLTPDVILEALSKKFDDFKRRTIDAILCQLRHGKFDLITKIKMEAAKITAKREMSEILSEAKKDIRDSVFINDGNLSDRDKAIEIIDSIVSKL